MLGQHGHASEMPFKWCFAGGGGDKDGPLIVVFGSSLSSSTKKTLSKLDPSDKTCWICLFNEAENIFGWDDILVKIKLGSRI